MNKCVRHANFLEESVYRLSISIVIISSRMCHSKINMDAKNERFKTSCFNVDQACLALLTSS